MQGASRESEQPPYVGKRPPQAEVGDLLPVCHALSIPLVYDVHHHRCNLDGLTEFEATDLAAGTWATVKREQYCHVSSPKNGWGGGDPKTHADYIALKDFPTCWLDRDMTVDIEAKDKERAVARLMAELGMGLGEARAEWILDTEKRANPHKDDF